MIRQVVGKWENKWNFGNVTKMMRKHLPEFAKKTYRMLYALLNIKNGAGK